VQKRIELPGPSEDQRARRTRERLAWSLVELLRTEAYEDISVQKIAARAEVGRSTFYAHFRDKEDLFIQHTVAFNRAFGAHLAWNEASRSWRFPVRGLFEHVREFRFLYDALARSRKLDRMLRIGEIVLAESFEQRIRTRPRKASDVPAPILAHHLAATLRGLMTWWMSHHCPKRAQEMDDCFHRLIGGVR